MKSMFVFLIVVLILAELSIFARVMFWPNFFSINERQSGSPIPNGPECRTESDFAAEKYRWLLRHTAQAYEKNGNHRSGEQNVIRFLTEVCRAVSIPTDPAVFQELAQRGSALIAGGYNNPMVRLWSGVMYFRAKAPENAGSLLTAAYDWEDTDYPTISCVFALKSLSSLTCRKNTPMPREQDDHLFWALDRFCLALLNGEFSTDEMPIAFRLLKKGWCGGDINRYEFVLNCLEQHGGGDAWLMHMLRGSNEIELAWLARGNGYSSEVTEEAWRGFEEHLTRAREILVETWEAFPNRPESAAAMITVTRGGHGVKGVSERTWFDRAVNLQMDCPDAYYELIEGLKPRWGGSRARMVAFGRECLATGRFDTDVPFFYLRALRKIAVELDHDRWRSVFRQKDEQPYLDLFFERMLADSTRLLARHRILMYQAEVAAWRGHYADARNLLRKVDSDVNPANGFLDQSITWSSRGRDVLESEILAFQGPQGDLLVRAEAIEFEGNTEAAIGLYRQAMSASSADPDAYGYLRDRIALLEVGQPAEKNAEPVLSVAVKQEAVDVVEFLIKHGADLQREDFYFWTPLHHAASVGNIQIANLLLDNGADLNARCMGFATPLHLSIKNHHPDMTRLLLDRQADVNASDNGGWTALTMALGNSQPDLAVDLIQRGGDIHAKTDWGWTPLLHAVKHSYGEVARILIDRGAMVDEPTDNGWTPLQIMVWDGNENMVRLLLDNGANADLTLPDGQTALDIARQRSFDSIERMLTKS